MSESRLNNLIAEARRRHVFRAAALYAAGAFVILQLADILLPAFGTSEAVISYLLVAIAAGFPFALILTWIVDITPEGIKVTSPLPEGQKAHLGPARVVDIAIVLIAVGVGYLYLERFVGDASTSDTLSSQAPSSDDGAPTELEPSIAVLPFDNLSTSEENAVFAAGIHEDILNYLSRNPALIVTSRKSTLAYQDQDISMAQIGQELNVNYLMEGSIRRSGNNIRVTVQLIEAGTDKHLWSETYDRELIDVFSVSDDVAQQVAEKLRVQFELFDEGRPTDNLRAYELFIEARELYGRYNAIDTRLAVTRYREALQQDPDYANAWAGLALAASAPESNEDLEEARNAAEEALRRVPDS